MWNVKEIAVRNPSFVFHVLIETLWNVKSVDHLQVDFSLRINRNIVECKENFGISEKPVETGINRTIVECKVGIALTCLECSG